MSRPTRIQLGKRSRSGTPGPQRSWSGRRETVHAVLFHACRPAVGANDLRHMARFTNPPVVDPEGVLAEPLELAGRMTDEQQRPAASELVDPVDALLLEGEVAD